MVGARVRSPGQLVASVLIGSWRRSPPALEYSAEELEEVAPLLQNSGAAALGWWRIQNSRLRDLSPAKQFHQAYRRNTLRAVINRKTIKQAVEVVRSVGIEPILVKGWTAARLYPEQGLRPHGDTDLCVPPEQFKYAESALEGMSERRHDVDLHRGFVTLGGGNVDEIYARSRLAKLGDTYVRVPCAEDHLRILCMHFLREGGWRPLWLCDIAASIEALPKDFDWGYCLGNKRSRSDAIICAIRLAHQLLAAAIDRTPAAIKTSDLPRWLVPAILKEWGSASPSMSRRHRAPIASYIRYPAGIFRGLRDRWPNPVEATITVGGPFNNLPRLPFQVGNCLTRTAKFAARLPKSLRG